MIYILDANFFIQAHRAHYPLDVVVSFWKKFQSLSSTSIDDHYLISIDKIQSELNHKQDELSNWCQKNLQSGFFKNSSVAMNEYSKVVQWASTHSTYTNAAKSEFLASTEADAFLVAYALTNPSDYTIVTHETSRPNIIKRIKLPEVCDAFGIKYCNTIEMFRQLKVKF